MKFKTNWVDVSYDIRFRKPSFIFITSQAALLKALYDGISPRFTIGPADMSVLPSPNVRESKTTVSLFNKNAALEITADSFHATFNNPLGENDIAIVKDTLALAIDAYSSVLTDAEPLTYGITVRAFLELKGPTDAWDYLDKTFGKGSPLQKFDVQGISNEISSGRVDVISTEERWTFDFALMRAIRSRSELFLTSNMFFDDGSAIVGLGDQGKKFQTLFSAALMKSALEEEGKAK